MAELDADGEPGVDVSFLTGLSVHVPLTPGSTVEELKAAIRRAHGSAPTEAPLQLLFGTELLKDADSAGTLAGARLTAFFARTALSTQASQLLVRISRRIKEAESGRIGLLEVHDVLYADDVPLFAEVLQGTPPDRLVFREAPDRGVLAELGKELRQDLSHLEVFHIMSCMEHHIAEIAPVLKRCPELKICKFQSAADDLTAEMVRDLRAQVTAMIVI